MVTARTIGHADRIGDRARRRQRIDTLTGRPSPWTFTEWLEWAEAVAADKLARAESFAVHATAHHPDRARVLIDQTWIADPETVALRREIGRRALDHAESPPPRIR
jgi:hypothetical protein